MEDATMRSMSSPQVHVRARLGSVLACLAFASLVPATPALAQDESPVTLRVAIGDGPTALNLHGLDDFISAANELSGGSITIEPFFRAGDGTELGFEPGAITRLLDGEAEMTLVGARGFDRAGIDAFRALQAPFLIDDDALALAVAGSDVATDMLADLADHGLTGLTLWPEDLRHPVALMDCTEPLVAPDQIKGLAIRVAPSDVAYDLFETLGGRPVFEDFDACTIPAAEAGLQAATLAGFPYGATFTGDVTVYTKYLVLAIDTDVFERLSVGQQEALREAAQRAHAAAIAARLPDVDRSEAWCAQGGRVVLAGPNGVAAFEAAARPVYDRLTADPKTAQEMAAIAAMKATVEPAPGAVACGTSPAPLTVEAADGPTPIDGTYVTHVTYNELVNSPLLYDPGEINDENWGDITVTFESGQFSLSLENPKDSYETSGVYRVDGDVLTLYDPNACCEGPGQFAFQWQLEGDQLTLTRMPDRIGPTTFLINAWTKVED
jgi:TRAP-type C4-dicarboxylate transport system substrate-binding protein